MRPPYPTRHWQQGIGSTPIGARCGAQSSTKMEAAPWGETRSSGERNDAKPRTRAHGGGRRPAPNAQLKR
jgi:hypothetical protein